EQTHAGAWAEDEVELAQDEPPAARDGETARHQEASGLAPRRPEVDVGAGARGPPPRGGQFVHQPPGFFDPRLLLGRARLGALPEPLDLAAHAIGEGLLIGGVGAQRLVPRDEEVAVAPRRLEEPGRMRAA